MGFGTTHIRTHVEIDHFNVSGIVKLLDSGRGVLGLEALFEVQERFSGLCDVQLSIFAQEGITNVEGMRDALRAACEMSSTSSSSISPNTPTAKLVAAFGLPLCGPNPRENLSPFSILLKSLTSMFTSTSTKPSKASAF
ncbi:hypothetical protein BJ742DRAFT_456860 [Cladochytrium replicatum]|nr:hypothetical protein BJ742DRAFT_456860 [Cladochytrium replicatum]